MRHIYIGAGEPKRNTIGYIKRQREFEERTISAGAAILEALAVIALFAAWVLICAIA